MRDNEYRVLVCGGRDYGKTWDEHLNQVVIDTYAVHLLQETLAKLAIPEGKQLVIIHGAALGADSLADAWACAHRIKTIPFPADWSGGLSGGIERNIQMLEDGEPDLVIAFPGGAGTAHMVSLARKTKTPLLVIEDENS